MKVLITGAAGAVGVFAVSDSDWPPYDLEHGRQVIGYDPQVRSVVPEDQRSW